MRKIIVLSALLLALPSLALSEAKNLQAMLVEKGVMAKGEAMTGKAGPSKVYWNGGTKIDFPDNGFTFGINTLLQTRYTFTDSDEDAGGENTSSFDVKNARIIVSGTALHEEFSYKLETDFVGKTDDDGNKSPQLLDAFIAWNACDWAKVKMGQFKTGVSRAYNTSEQYQQFADRDVSTNFFNLGRQQGLAGKTMLADGMIEVGAAIFNGSNDLSDDEGINRTGGDKKHAGVANIRFNAMGKMNPYIEGDIDNTDDAALSIGAAYAYVEGTLDIAGVANDATQQVLSADVTFKQGGLSIAGEFYTAKSELDDVDGAENEPTGWYVQAGYFLEPKTWELAGRYGYIDCDDSTDSVCEGSENVGEVTAGLNYYWWAHHLKAQLNFVHLVRDGLDGAEDTDDNRWLLQLSAYL